MTPRSRRAAAIRNLRSLFVRLGVPCSAAAAARLLLQPSIEPPLLLGREHLAYFRLKLALFLASPIRRVSLNRLEVRTAGFEDRLHADALIVRQLQLAI